MKPLHSLMPVALLAAVAVAGCSAAPNDAPASADAPTAEPPNTETTGTTVQPLKVNDQGTWTQGQPALTLAPSSTNFCFLGGVKGYLVDSSEAVSLSDDGANWVLSGTGRSGLSATAYCVPMNGVPKLTRDSNAPYAYLWWGAITKSPTKLGPVKNRICFVAGVQGPFDNELSFVNVWSDGTNWNLAGSDPSMMATAYCVNGITERSDVFNLDAFQSTAPVVLELASEYACGLTSFQGNFRGTSESAQITKIVLPGGGPSLWELQTTSHQTGGVSASAECFR